MSDSPDHLESCDDRTDCFVSKTRRDFLRESFLSVAGALIAVGATRAQAFAMPLSFVEARGRSGSARSYAIPAMDGAQIDRDNQVILVRWQNEAYAFNLSCPHQNTALKWNDRDRQFQCPKHHSTFQPDGTKIEGRAPRSMDRLGLTREPTGLTVDLSHVIQQDKDPAGWSAAVVNLA